MSSVLKETARIPPSMSPIQKWNIGHFSICHGKSYWETVALTPRGHMVGSHRVSGGTQGRREDFQLGV